MILAKRFFVCLLLLVVACAAYSQGKGTIEFIAEENTEVTIYRPIDGAYNASYPTDTIQLKKDKKQIYQVDTDEWAIVKCQLPKKLGLDLFIEKGDTLCIIITEQDVVFKGDNAASNDYLYLYSFLKDQKIKEIADPIFKANDMKQLDEVITTPRLMIRSLGIIEKIDSMYIDEQISSCCYSYLQKNLDYRLRFRLLRKLDEYYFHGYISDSVYNYSKNRIVDEMSIDFKDIRSSEGVIFLDQFYNRLYEQLDDNVKKSLISCYGKETFGLYYISFLLAPEKIQLSRLFNASLMSYLHKNNLFNRFKMFEYLNNKYPKSESVQILRTFIEEEARDTVPIQKMFLDSIPINTLSDIQQLEPFKGKYLFIDVWASWCMPCRSEFFYNKQLNELLNQYSNIEKIYISIDAKEDRWKSAIEALRISGYHLRASDKLSECLVKEIYQSGRITVPRYILIDNVGKIVNSDLPRPSSIEKLKAELDKRLK